METQPSKPRKTTIVDVAKLAGVSHATVSRVLNNQGYVADDTRRKVLDAVEQLGYVANLQARSLAGGASCLVGLVVPHFFGDYIGQLTRSISNELFKAGYELAVFPTHRNPASEQSAVSRVISGMGDGLLLVLPSYLENYLDIIKAYQCPYVLIDSELVDPEISVVATTNWQGAYDATCYLLSLGHRRIAHLAGLVESRASAIERMEGYRAALAEYDIEVDETLVQPGRYSRAGGAEGAKALLALPDPPTAIFAANDSSAFGAMQTIRDAGVVVPDDISVVGFDDVAEAASTFPPLTTIKTPIEHIGRLAARTLVDRIHDPARPAQRIALATSLVERESCAPPRTTSLKNQT